MAGSKEAVRRINFITTSRGFVEAAAAGAGSTTEDALLKEMTHPMFYRQSREAMDEVCLMANWSLVDNLANSSHGSIIRYPGTLCIWSSKN